LSEIGLTNLRKAISDPQLRVGFIGCGEIASYHADVLIALGCSIQAVAARAGSKNIDKFLSRYKNVAAYDSWSDMVAEQDLDALWVVASWNAIDDLLLPVLECDLPIFFEKPVALSSAKLEMALRIVGKKSNYIQVGYNRRFYSHIPTVRNYLKSHQPRSVLLEIPEVEPPETDPLSKYILYQNSCHAIDLLYHLIGEFEIEHLVVQNSYGSSTSNTFNGMFLSIDSIPINFISNWNVPSNTNITFYCEDSVLKLSPLEIASIYSGLEVIEPTVAMPLRKYNPVISEQFLGVTKSDRYKPGFLEQAKCFIDNVVGIEANKEFVPASLRDSLFVVKLVESIYKYKK